MGGFLKKGAEVATAAIPGVGPLASAGIHAGLGSIGGLISGDPMSAVSGALQGGLSGYSGASAPGSFGASSTFNNLSDGLNLGSSALQGASDIKPLNLLDTLNNRGM